jgi:FG-GAP-like repeat/FG-GAP repeat
LKRLVAVACLLVLFASSDAAGRPAASGPSFARARSYRTGVFPVSVAIGNLNGDGKPDLATANYGSETVSVLVNKGDGSFGPKRSYVVGTDASGGPRSVAIGDLNADGKADIVAANEEEGFVSVLLNNGQGRFQTKRDYRTGGGRSVAIGDLNGDGKADLATGTGGKAVSVLLNRGDGSFGAKRYYRTGGGASSVAIADLNGDGKQDLATANEFANTVSVLLNRGDGSFAAKRDYRTGSEPSSVAIGDLNRDGTPDLATANDDPNADANTVSVLLNKVSGRFAAKRDYRSQDVSSVAIGDLTGDGRLDLATGSYATAASVLVNKGGGRFQPELDYAVGSAPTSVAIGDLNGDGKADLATANREDDSVSVLLNRPGLCTVQSVTGGGCQAQGGRSCALTAASGRFAGSFRGSEGAA